MQVRNQLIGLFLNRGDFIEIGDFKVYPKVIPIFLNTKDGLMQEFHLKISPGGVPSWDMKLVNPAYLDPLFDNFNQLAFNDQNSREAAKIIKKLSKHFPYKPTDNFFHYIDPLIQSQPFYVGDEIKKIIEEANV